MGAQVSHEPPPPLPGEQVYYTGESMTFESGDRLEHGKQGVVGPATGENLKGKGVTVRFFGNKGANDWCYLDQATNHSSPSPQCCPSSLPAHSQCTVWVHKVSREPPPPLPGDYSAGELVYFTGKSHTFKSGDRLEHGKQGEVVGPGTGESHRGKGVRVRFPGNEGATNCWLNQVRRRRANDFTLHPIGKRAA